MPGQRSLGLGFVVLDAVRQSPGHEDGFESGAARPLDRELAQPAGGGRVGAAADGQHQRGGPGAGQGVGELRDPPLDLATSVEAGVDAQFAGDVPPGPLGGRGVVHDRSIPAGGG
jgi:hypothetical protein